MSEFEIAGRKVGLDHKPLIIAEIGINHEGSLKTAFEMVDAAHRAGIEVVKHQTHIVEDEMASEAKKSYSRKRECFHLRDHEALQSVRG